MHLRDFCPALPAGFQSHDLAECLMGSHCQGVGHIHVAIAEAVRDFSASRVEAATSVLMTIILNMRALFVFAAALMWAISLLMAAESSARAMAVESRVIMRMKTGILIHIA